MRILGPVSAENIEMGRSRETRAEREGRAGKEEEVGRWIRTYRSFVGGGDHCNVWKRCPNVVHEDVNVVRCKGGAEEE